MHVGAPNYKQITSKNNVKAGCGNRDRRIAVNEAVESSRVNSKPVWNIE